MLTTYLSGALVTAMATLAGATRFSDPRSTASPLTRVAVAFLTGALWPVVAVGVLALLATVPLLEYLGTAPGSRVEARRIGEPVLTGRARAA